MFKLVVKAKSLRKSLILLGYETTSVGIGCPFASSGASHCTAQYPLSSSGPAKAPSLALILGRTPPPTSSGLNEKKVSINQSLSLFDKCTELVSGHINTIETGEGISSTGIINNQSNLPPSESFLTFSEVRLDCLNNSTFDAIFDFF